MLRQLDTKEELENVLDLTKPSNVGCGSFQMGSLLHYCLRFHIEGKFPDVKYNVLGFPSLKPTNFCMFCHTPGLPIKRAYFHIPPNSIEKTDFLDALIDEYFRNSTEVFCFGLNQNIYSELCENKLTKLGEVNYFAEPHFGYFIQEGQNLFREKIEAPQGYYWDCLTENDIPALKETWQHSGPNEEIRIKLKISKLPNAALRTIDTHELACFEMVAFEGFMNHLFTMENHRRKGLATLVEKQLAQKLAEIGVLAWKFVGIDNKIALTHTKANPIWTEITPEQQYYFIKFIAET